MTTDIARAVARVHPRPRREVTCFCCGMRYRVREWRCCAAPVGEKGDAWFDRWHRYEDADGRKRSHCPRHPCGVCLEHGAIAEPLTLPPPVQGTPQPTAPPVVKPFEPEDDADWKERAAGDSDALKEEVGF